MFARIRAHLRRTQEEETDLLEFADLELNTSTREVYRGTRLIELTAKEFDLLEYLPKNHGSKAPSFRKLCDLVSSK